MLNAEELEVEREKRTQRTLFGIPLSIHWVELELIERLLREIHPTLLVEIGTGPGALSLYFAVWAQLHRGKLWTTDVSEDGIDEDTAQVIHALGGVDFQMDPLCPAFAGYLNDRGPARSTFVFCNGDDKAAELIYFSPMLRPGDVIAVHGWGTDVKASDFQKAWADEHGLDDFLRQQLQHEHCRIRAWKKRQ